jgi:hypothetical protein
MLISKTCNSAGRVCEHDSSDMSGELRYVSRAEMPATDTASKAPKKNER